MRRLVLFVLALLLSVAPLQAVAVGTATVTTANVRDGSTRYVRYRIAWLCNASGAVSGNPFSVSAGRIVSVRFTPNLAGTQPTDQYDVTVLDTDSVDVIFGAGANLTNAAGAVTRLTIPFYQDGSRQLDVVVANAGNAKTGTVELMIQVQ
jgi:hypothetical protein